VLLGEHIHRKTTWVALFALLVQVTLSFPHICPDDLFGLAAPTGLRQPALSGALDIPDSPLCPLSDGRAGDASCAIYASMHVAGSLLLPDRIQLDVPSATGKAQSWTRKQLHLARPPHLLFQTRAPPVS
jgi:hypothetical protein